MTASSARAVFFAASCAAAWLASVGLAVVLARIGLSPQIMVALLAGLLVAGAALGGALGGTMRFGVFLVGGRALPPVPLGLAMATGWAALATGPAGRPAGMLGLGLGLALVLALVGPAIRRSGAPTLPMFLRHAFRSPALRAVAAAVVASAGVLLGAERLLSFYDAAAPLFGLGRAASGVLLFALIATILAPGGARGLALALLALGTAGLVAVASIAWWRGGAGLATPAAWTAGGLDWTVTQAAAAAMTVAAPHLATLAGSARHPADLRRALVPALLAALAFGAAAALAGPGATLGPTLALALLELALDLACAAGLLLAAGSALGFDLPGRAKPRRRSLSARFAWLRLATLLVAGAAAWIAASRPDLVRGLSAAAAAVLAAALAPPALLAALRPGSSPGSGLAACLAGLATALALLDGRVAALGEVAAWLAAEPGAAGLVVGLACGGAVALATARRPPRPPIEDEAF
ncbi:hypothetical protein NK718_06260 [Alsobacter sp. SYSU M60028]|uniref:Uncharacterized protein n=1 Tax=Alsobacter ponti TaxID=2962936 RepID=A0ABT1L9E1_9HYPH|nr:hypothetical protein [Alsobacter ponti]MCP8938112.1 hypothetical protein [Alsobacter ponti]